MKYQRKQIDEITQSEIDDWRRLYEKCERISPLDDPDFVRCAARFCDGEVILGFNQGKLASVLPMQLGRNGTAEPLLAGVSDCSQFVFDPDLPISIRTMLKATGIRRFCFDHLFGHEKLDPMKYSYSRDTCYLIDLARGFDSYVEDLKSSGTSILSQLARKKRKLENEVGPVRFERSVSNSGLLEQLIEWKSEQLNRQGFRPVFSSEIRAFMKAHLGADSRYSRGELSTLTAGDQVVALHFGTTGIRSVNSWIPAVNPEYAKYSTGGLLYLELARDAVHTGQPLVILGRGENQTKVRLSNREIPNYLGSLEVSFLSRLCFPLKRNLHRFKQSGAGKTVRRWLRNWRAKRTQPISN